MVHAMSIEEMRGNADDLATKLRVMANRDRLVMLCRLSEGEAAVGELVEITGLAQSLVSQHLAMLRKAGAVKVRSDRQLRYYSIADDKVRAIFEALCDICRPGGG